MQRTACALQRLAAGDEVDGVVAVAADPPNYGARSPARLPGADAGGTTPSSAARRPAPSTPSRPDRSARAPATAATAAGATPAARRVAGRRLPGRTATVGGIISDSTEAAQIRSNQIDVFERSPNCTFCTEVSARCQSGPPDPTPPCVFGGSRSTALGGVLLQGPRMCCECSPWADEQARHWRQRDANGIRARPLRAGLPRRSTRRRSRSLAARARTWGSCRGSKASACRLASA